ncbi:MAG TPA: class I SAM-dependent methyltransferase [Herpetosiphonaceae bacterium]
MPTFKHDVLLGEIEGRRIRLTPATLDTSIEHAHRIAAELGSRDAMSSVAAYWMLDSRLRQWQQIVGRIGLDRARHARFAEIGSGMGLFTLVGCALGLNVIGVEASSDRYQASLRTARRLFADNEVALRLIQAPSEALPLPDASMDLIASFQTIEHVADLPQTLREIRRVLKPGGIFFAQAPNYSSFYEAHYGVFVPLGLGKAWTRRYLALLGRPTGFLEHLQWLDPAALRGLLRDGGFTSVTVDKASTPPLSADYFRAWLYPLPFRFRRGLLAQRLAHALARLAVRAQYTADRYPQLEVWARA